MPQVLCADEYICFVDASPLHNAELGLDTRQQLTTRNINSWKIMAFIDAEQMFDFMDCPIET